VNPADDLQLGPAAGDDLTWVEALVRGDAAAALSTAAADGLADAAAAGELLVARIGGQRVGAVVVATVNRRSRIAAVRTLVVDPAARGRGLGAAILRAVAREAFARGVHRLEGEVYGFNAPARRAFAAAGFVAEGVRRRAYDRHGAWQDGIHFGLLADDG
jgi:RimJ/RimL family protein N-acetyltransferase